MRARAAADPRLPRAGQNSGFTQRRSGAGLRSRSSLTARASALPGRDLHQPARHVHGVAGRGDVLVAAAAEPRGDDRAEMGADLEAGSRGDRRRQGRRSNRSARLQRSTQHSAALLASSAVLSGRPNRIMAPSPRKLVMTPPRAIDLVVDQGVEFLQHPQYRVHAERFAERGEAGQIDEDDRRVLVHRLEQEIRILRSAICRSAGAWNCCSKSLFIAKYCACRRFSQSCTAPNRIAGGAAAAIGSAALNQTPSRECGEVGDQHHTTSTAAIGDEADRAAPPGQQATSKQRRARPPRSRRARASSGRARCRRRSSDWPIAVAMISTPGHHRIERGGKHVAAAGDGRADDDDAIFRGWRPAAPSPFSSAAALMVRIVPWRP